VRVTTRWHLVGHASSIGANAESSVELEHRNGPRRLVPLPTHRSRLPEAPGHAADDDARRPDVGREYPGRL